MDARLQDKTGLSVFVRQSAKSEKFEENLSNLNESINNRMGRSSCHMAASCAWTQCNMRCLIQHRHGEIRSSSSLRLVQDGPVICRHPAARKQSRVCA
ncbi:MAG TPA: hypothetical protein DET40_25980 [Lentisphaeria bacterium]|nr:MAG: hypothetical protein A2X45_15080 [Lentisphaerae bacterium GWF2_50_93]HCE47012.1 hypothetical protein [Lentisphaeria bacterium]